MPKDLAYWVALSTNIKIGARTFKKLLVGFGSMEEVWKSSTTRFLQAGISREIIHNISEVKNKTNPQEELDRVEKLGIRVITIKDKNYPSLLAEIPDPPAVLYLKGEILPQDNMSIAIVGSRKYTSYGQRVTEDLTRSLAGVGLTIVSGLALGIDGISHQAALSVSKGRTIAVLANGLDQVYPYSHRGLAEKILQGRGALVSEYPLGTPALKHHFPVRNRIIAGLSLGVVVVEGALASGSLLTARAALDYNREVFAVPGSIYAEASAGPNNLVKIGAKSVTSVEDILQELNISTRAHQEEAKEIIPDSKEEAVILDVLNSDKPVHVDKLAKLSKLDIATLNSQLVLMEMKGKVRNLGASQYVLGR